jgi:prepilin peptidase CpaA
MFGMTLGGGSESSNATLAWCVVLLAAVVAAIWDLRTGRIPNLLTFPVFLAGLVWSTWHGGGSSLLAALGSAILLALPCFILFVYAGGGAGDVKLLGALGAWLSLHDAVLVLLCVALAGAVCGIISVTLRRRSAILFSNLARMGRGFALALATRRVRDAQILMPEEKQMQPMAYGVSICLGVWVAAGGRWLWQW